MNKAGTLQKINGKILKEGHRGEEKGENNFLSGLERRGRWKRPLCIRTSLQWSVIWQVEAVKLFHLSLNVRTYRGAYLNRMKSIHKNACSWCHHLNGHTMNRQVFLQHKIDNVLNLFLFSCNGIFLLLPQLNRLAAFHFSNLLQQSPSLEQFNLIFNLDLKNV